MEYEKLTAIISDVLNINPEDITPESSFVNDFGADSLPSMIRILSTERKSKKNSAWKFQVRRLMESLRFPTRKNC